MPTVSEGKKQISSTVPIEIVERIEYYVEDEKRTFSQMVQILLNEALDARDKKPKSSKK